MPKDVQLEVADGIEGPWRVVKAFTVEATVPARQVRYIDGATLVTAAGQALISDNRAFPTFPILQLTGSDYHDV